MTAHARQWNALNAPARLALASVVAVACGASAGGTDYTITGQFPHDTAAYTQGLVYAGGALYESTGRYGQSTVRRVDVSSGEITAVHHLADDRFGEGLTFLDGRLYQLTWKSGVGYVHDAASLVPVDSFPYDGEGWGLTTDGTFLIKSNGTAELEFLEPGDFQVVRTLQVHDRGSPLQGLNELEYVDGHLLANVYQSDWIVRIDLETGEVLQWLDFAGILPDDRRSPATDVLNGIAFVGETGRFLVTGKLWPLLFEVEIPQGRE